MISEKLQKALNEQITAEMWSANLYLSMSFYFEKEGFNGFAHWMKKQSQEEMDHAYQMASYLIKRGGTALVDKIDVVPTGWGNPLEVFKHVYDHECHVSKLINDLLETAQAEKDYATQSFLWEFVKEQIEEDLSLPSKLDNTLRYYQKTGFRWLKTLDKYHFGGILADDMGLRKNNTNISCYFRLCAKGKRK